MKYLAIALLLLGSVPAFADDDPQPIACPDVVAEIVHRTGLEVTGSSPSGQRADFANPYVDELSALCEGPTESLWSVGGGRSTAFPNNDYYELLSTAAGALTKDPPKKIEAAMRACYRKAIKDKGEQAEANTSNSHVECQAFLRDGGAVYMDVFKLK